MTILRILQIVIVAAFALYFSVVILNNVTDYSANFGFIENVLSMSETFYNDTRWRAINSDKLHHFFYILIILIEMGIGILLWVGLYRMWKQRFSANFKQAKDIGILGLGLAFCLWFTVFITIGGEWFLMWQSEHWNGNPTAFRNASLSLLALLILLQKED